jgi:hypothetical protein
MKVHCRSCERENRADRRFCGGCGAALALSCASCDFANDVGDQFCGGCGSQLGRKAAAPVAATVMVMPSTGAPDPDAIDLNELFRPATSTEADLPDDGIGQRDLDRMFGGMS